MHHLSTEFRVIYTTPDGSIVVEQESGRMMPKPGSFFSMLDGTEPEYVPEPDRFHVKAAPGESYRPTYAILDNAAKALSYAAELAIKHAAIQATAEKFKTRDAQVDASVSGVGGHELVRRATQFLARSMPHTTVDNPSVVLDGHTEVLIDGQRSESLTQHLTLHLHGLDLVDSFAGRKLPVTGDDKRAVVAIAKALRSLNPSGQDMSFAMGVLSSCTGIPVRRLVATSQAMDRLSDAEVDLVLAQADAHE